MSGGASPSRGERAGAQSAGTSRLRAVKSDGLTDRQLDVLELALHGLTNQQIGGRLFLSVDTVKTHLRRTYAQLHDDRGQPATGALHAIALALKRGWLVYDAEARAISRPPHRRPLPATPEPEKRQPLTVQQRRAALGW